MNIMDMQMNIERAQSTDHQSLTEIAHRAKRHWNYPERWMTIWRPNLTLQPEFVAEHPVYALKRDGRILGFYALVDEESEEPGTWTLEHMWIDPGEIGQGLGKVLFEHLLGEAKARGATAIRILSDPNATGFYERMGADYVGDHLSELEGEPRILPIYVKQLS